MDSRRKSSKSHSRRPARRPESWTRIAEERIAILLDLALREVREKPERAKRHVELARKIGMRYNVRLEERKRLFCRKCSIPLIPGFNSRVRARKDRKAVIVTCCSCGHVSRHPYLRERKANIKR